jgi:DNA-binding response OmpR family regulator
MSETKKAYKVLYVEDNSQVLKNYASFMERYFDEVYTALNAEEAYEIYKANSPDILLIDIELPGESGIDLLRKIRKSDHNVRAIMLTAMSDVDTLLDATELKLTKYLVKPILRDELKVALFMAIEEIENFTVAPKKLLHINEDAYWDYDKEELFWYNKEIPLTRKERDLLRLLFSNASKIFSTEDIIYELWYDYDSLKVSSLKTLIKTLRKKVPDGMIKNVFGVGYKIDIA